MQVWFDLYDRVIRKYYQISRTFMTRLWVHYLKGLDVYIIVYVPIQET